MRPRGHTWPSVPPVRPTVSDETRGEQGQKRNREGNVHMGPAGLSELFKLFLVFKEVFQF